MQNYNALVHKIVEYLPNEKLTFRKNHDCGLDVIINNSRMHVTIVDDSTWEAARRCIDEAVQKGEDLNCPICYEERISWVCCSVCSKTQCSTCYYTSIRRARGVAKCPFCNDTYGEELSPAGVDKLIKYLHEDTVNTLASF